MGMVCTACVRAGRLRDGVDIINKAKDVMRVLLKPDAKLPHFPRRKAVIMTFFPPIFFFQVRGTPPSIQVSIVHSILASIPMRCVAEEDAARAFVEGLTDLADFTNGEPSRDYFRRIAVGQVQNSILPACGCEMAYGVALAMRCAVLRKGCVLCAVLIQGMVCKSYAACGTGIGFVVLR